MKHLYIIPALLMGWVCLSLTAHPSAPAALCPCNTDISPASLKANSELLREADGYFFRHDWVAALHTYEKASIKGLGAGDRSLYSYRMAFCLIKTGHYAEARRWLADVKGAKYAEARKFYTAYLDYIAGDHRKAAEGFRSVRKGIPGLDADYYLLQLDYMAGDYKKVTANAPGVIRSAPAELKPELDRITGMSFFKLGEYGKAVSYLHDYSESNGGGIAPETEYALAVMEYETGDYSTAEKRLASVTDVTGPLGQGAWLLIGQCRVSQGDLKGATLAFEKGAAYEADPAVAETSLYNYVTALTRGGSVPFSRSTQMLETFIRRWPDSPHTEDVEEYLAQAYYNDHDYEGAVACVDASANPSRALLEVKQKALFQQGVREATNGHWSQSATWFEKASKMNSVDASLASQARLWLADARYSAGDYKQAVRDYNAYLAADAQGSNRALALYDLAYAQYKLGKYRDAAATFAKALDCRPALRKPLADDASIRRADCLYYTGDYSSASLLFSKAISSGAADADYAAYRRAITVGLSEEGRAKIQALEAFMNDYPNSRWISDALLEKALTHEELGETKAAAEAYRRRLSVAPDVNIDELIAMARATDRSGDAPAEQLRIIERIRRSANLPADEVADIDLYEANARAALGEDEVADAIYLRLSRQPEALSAAIAAVTLADRLNARKEHQEAYDLMSEFTDQGSPHIYWLARGFIALADACKGINRPDLAKEYLISLRENYPGDEPDIRSAIESRLKNLKK